MEIILRKKYIFTINEKSLNDKWIFLKGHCNDLLSRETTICLENTIKNRKRIIDNTKQ